MKRKIIVTIDLGNVDYTVERNIPDFMTETDEFYKYAESIFWEETNYGFSYMIVNEEG